MMHQLKMLYRPAKPGAIVPTGDFFYQYPGLHGESEEDPPRAAMCWLGKLGLVCEPEGRIRNVSGYLPHQAWVMDDGAELGLQGQVGGIWLAEGFAVDEDSRSLECPFVVQANPQRRTLRIRFDGEVTRLVRVHQKLDIGLSEHDDAVYLSEIICRDIEVTYSPGCPTPW